MFATQTFLFFISITATASAADIIWKDNSAKKCDFSVKDDFESVHTTEAKNCPDICAKTYGCTHYVWSLWNSNGTCYLKHDPYVTRNDAYASSVESAVCGIIATTVAWNDNNSWTWRCDFPSADDFARVPSVREDCERICSENDRCTHFTWSISSGGTCYLKRRIGVSRSDAFKSANKSTACGIINRSTIDF